MKTQTKQKTTIDVDKIRKDFPILSRDIRGKKLIYLDSAATSQKPKQVIDAISTHYSTHNANVHRGVHKLTEEATEAYEAARKKVANFVNAGDSRQIVFVRNATEAINLVAYSWGRKNLKRGDEILLTQMEHHSNLVPWQQLAKEIGVKLRFIPVNSEGLLELNKFEDLISKKTKMVAFTHVSNVLGIINPVKQMVERVRAVNPNIKILIDGAQAVPHMPVSIQHIKPDFYAFSGHKMLGPSGIGVLYAKKELLESMNPFISGGDMILRVSFDKAFWNYIPWKFEAGTPNIEGAIGLGAAVDYLAAIGMKNVRAHEQDLTQYALQKLSKVANLEIYGLKINQLAELEKRACSPVTLSAAMRVGVISFNIVKNPSRSDSGRGKKIAIHPHDLVSILDAEGIEARSGRLCAEPLLNIFKAEAAARVSFHVYNTKEEIDVLIPALEKAKKIFKI